MMYLIRKFRSRKLDQFIVEQRAFYKRHWTPETTSRWQLEQFNNQWSSIRSDVPYFRELCGRIDLPTQFCSWQEFKSLMPVMDRKTVQTNRYAVRNNSKRLDEWRITGGSTAEPLQVPIWDSEKTIASKDIWYARSWFGVEPSDRLFMIWGHSHLLGKGIHGWLNGIKRRLGDRGLGYCRWSAYDLNETELQKAARVLIEFEPAYIVGYSVALDRFAKANNNLKSEFRNLNMKVVIATGESFPTADSQQLIAELFGCPVVMEYGTVEIGPIAHQKADGLFSVFWRHFFIEGVESDYLPGAYELLITSLYSRCFPLVRYKVGDLVSPILDNGNLAGQFDSLIGRCNDLVTLGSGSVVHSEAFTHAIRELPYVTDYQVVQSRDGEISLNYVGPRSLESIEIATVRERLDKINPGLSEIQIERVGSLQQTIAGKTKRIFREQPVEQCP